MKVFKSLVFSGIVLLAGNIPFSSSGQDTTRQAVSDYKYKGWALTAKGGVFSPFTDVRSNNIAFSSENGKSEMSYGGGLDLTHMFNSAFGLQANFLYGSLLGIAAKNKSSDGGQDPFSSLGFSEPVYFETDLISGGLSAYINFNNLALALIKANQTTKHDRWLSIFGTIGVGVVNFDSQIKSLSSDTVYSVAQTNAAGEVIGGLSRGISGTTTALEAPFSLGAKLKLSRSFDLGLEVAMHVVNSDKLDAFVINQSTPFKGNKDKYAFTGLGLTYKFVGKDKNNQYIEWKDPVEVMYDDFKIVKDQVTRLSTDTDNDGISEMYDKEPNTPVGSKVYGDGTSVDTDNDGVPDARDKDLFTPAGCSVDTAGIGMDIDKDGVPDCLDKEANTAADAMVDLHGVTIPKPPPNTGFIMPTVYFDTNSSTVKTTAYPDLAALAKYMQLRPEVKVQIVGNADIRGSESYNKGLGTKRANSVKDFLVTYYQIDESRIVIESVGEANQLYPKVYTVNRRVEIQEMQDNQNNMQNQNQQNQEQKNQEEHKH